MTSRPWRPHGALVNGVEPGQVKKKAHLGLRAKYLLFLSDFILVPATEHGYFVASWWRAPLRHPPKVTIFYFSTNFRYSCASGTKEKAALYPVEVPPPIADSFHVATMARKQSVLNLREIDRNNTHTSLASMLTYYGWVSFFFSFFVVTQRNIV
jgi:hypothetical protein